MPLEKTLPFATREQELLLQAALLEGEDAINAWERWKNAVDLEGHPDNGSYRLFPLLYKNLERHGIKHPFMSRLRGIYRQAWYKNQRLFYEMSNILRDLNNAGVRTMVLKGAALAVLCYKNDAVRPMADVDVLVHPSQVFLTVDVLARAGWMPTSELTEADLKYRHSHDFKDSLGKEFDLHWHLLFESCWEGSDSDFWNGSVPLTLGGVSTLSLNPTDLLLHVIVHGVRWNAEPPIRWIADAASLVTSPVTVIDWNRFIAQARKHRVVLRVKKALNYLKDTYQAPVPESTIRSINKIRISPLDILEYRYIMSAPETLPTTYLGSLLGGGALYFMEYRRLHDGTRNFSSITGLPKYLQYRMNRKNLYDLFSYLALRGLRITKRKLMTGMKTDNAG